MAIPPWISCSGGNSSISIFGSGSSGCLLFLQLFLEAGNFFLVGHSQVHNVKNNCFVHFFWRFAKLYIFGNVRIYCFGKPMFAFLIVAMATMLED